jgi:GTP pyrophosphokinase
MDELDKSYEQVEHLLLDSHPESDFELVRKAYAFGKTAHEGQLRKSGEPFYIHPIEVAHILAELGMGDQSIAAAFLHDTIEDTDVSHQQVKREFGETIANLVEGVTKLTKLEVGDAANAETIRKMIVAMSKDIRVLVIKLADRLHNARTWKFVSAESAAKKAQETVDIYAPLAHRLGLNQIKRELEDLSFQALHPKIYAEIDREIQENSPERDKYIKELLEQVYDILDDSRVNNSTVSGRPKHHYSIYQKMLAKKKDFKDIHDLIGIRIITETVLDCYAALGAVHAKWNHLPGRFKDYIAMPKYNMYQSLHTTVLGPEGRTVEIQIRTREMHQFAQYGVAAHWRYKAASRGEISDPPAGVNENEGKTVDLGSLGDSANRTIGTGNSPTPQELRAEENLKWVKQIVEWQNEMDDSEDFLDSLRDDLAADEVFVFSPKGMIYSLPSGSTPVDFAYSVHTDVGHRTMGARVNGRLVPLDSELQNGDTVEILTTKSEEAGPSRGWLNFVKSQRAKNKIKVFFSKSRREEDIIKGKDDLAKAIKGKNLPMKRILTHEILVEIADELGQNSVDELYHAIGRGHFKAGTVLTKILELESDDLVDEIVDEPGLNLRGVRDSALTGDTATERPINPGISVSGDESMNDVWIKLAKCCTPVPGDEIVGFVTKGNGISVHRSDCFNIHVLRKTEEPSRFVDASWIAGAATQFLVSIQVEGLDRSAMLANVTRVLSENHVNILSGQIETTKDRVAISRWTFEMADPNHLNSVINAVSRVEGVYDVYRITGKKAEGL